MNLGEPQRIHEVEPLQEPVPDTDTVELPTDVPDFVPEPDYAENR
jgi:hypothetical protein